MDRWEYYVLSADLHGKSMFKEDRKTTLDILRDLGREGWELVNAIKTMSNALLSDEYTFFFKRRIA